MRSITLAALLLSGLLCPSAEAQCSRIVEFSLTPVARAQLALWIETDTGEYLQTIRLTEAVGMRGIGNRPGASQMNSGYHWPYGRREGVLPVWAHRRAAAGEPKFRRVIFQNRRFEGLASRTSADHSKDYYFCLSRDQKNNTKEALDAMTCASQFFSDKGRFITEEDVLAGYGEPFALGPTQEIFRPLTLLSLYPPRRDVLVFESRDHADASLMTNHATTVMPELDAVTMATPTGEIPLTIGFAVPEAWPNGSYVAWLEINTEGDHNAVYSQSAFPTPNSDNWDANTHPCTSGVECPWDHWAEDNGYPFRGQPSVVYRLPFELRSYGDARATDFPFGYGSMHGEDGDVRPMDSSISDDPHGAPGSGADRLRRDLADQRFYVVAPALDLCAENPTPEWCSAACTSDGECGPDALCENERCVARCCVSSTPQSIEDLQIAVVEDSKLAHRIARMRFTVPESRRPLGHYRIRTSTSSMMSNAEDAKAPAYDDRGEVLAIPEGQLRIPTDTDCSTEDSSETLCAPYLADASGQCPSGIDHDGDGDCLDPGDEIDVKVAFGRHETLYYISVDASDICQASAPGAMASVKTRPIDFETVSPCFIASAAYGSPLADEVWVLRDFRDRYLMPHSLGRAFVRVYYQLGPHAAAWVEQYPWLATLTRTFLTPIVHAVRWLIY